MSDSIEDFEIPQLSSKISRFYRIPSFNKDFFFIEIVFVNFSLQYYILKVPTFLINEHNFH